MYHSRKFLTRQTRLTSCLTGLSHVTQSWDKFGEQRHTENYPPESPLKSQRNQVKNQ